MISEQLLKEAENLKPRLVEKDLQKELGNHKVLILLGTRRCGKTSVLKRLIKYLVDKKTSTTQIFYYDLENFKDLEEVNSFDPTHLSFFLSQKGANQKEKIYLFIDEIQYLDSLSSFLKLAYDHSPLVQIITSGSSSLEIKSKMKDSLVGRKRIYFLPTLTFLEFLLFKEEKGLYNNLLSTTNPWQELPFLKIKSVIFALEKLFEEFIIFGGYPEVVLKLSLEEKIRELSDIYSSYVDKDIKGFLRLANLDKFNRLTKVLAVNIGNLLNLSDLSLDISLSKPTLENYLFLLENTFIINRIPPFFRNKRKELVATPKIYFSDSGLRNSGINIFEPLALRPDKGALFENAIFSQLTKKLTLLEKINYWRTQAGAEVDFVLEKGLETLPIEVKYQSFKKPEIPSGLKAFIKEYKPKKAIVVTKDFWVKEKFKDCQVLFLPSWLV